MKHPIQPRNILPAICLCLFALTASAQQREPLYDPLADAGRDLELAILAANQEQKHVLVQIGGNWCPWCYRLHDFMQADHEIDSLMQSDYILVRINYSPENRNHAVLASLDYPQRFGFPVLLVLDGEGARLHTQDTALLESGESYDRVKVITFLKNWDLSSLDPDLYRNIE